MFDAQETWPPDRHRCGTSFWATRTMSQTAAWADCPCAASARNRDEAADFEMSGLGDREIDRVMDW